MRVLLRKRSAFPECVRHIKQLKGICIGTCINPNTQPKDDLTYKSPGHSHPYHGKYQGWICLKYKYQLKEKNTLLHEAAHLIANKARGTPAHGVKWKSILIKLGGTLHQYFSYNKKFIYDDFHDHV
jgi:hypothetical protein